MTERGKRKSQRDEHRPLVLRLGGRDSCRSGGREPLVNHVTVMEEKEGGAAMNWGGGRV